MADEPGRVAFDCVEDWHAGTADLPRKHRHLEALGWTLAPVAADTWRELRTYDRKARHVRELLVAHKLL